MDGTETDLAILEKDVVAQALGALEK